MRLGSELFYPYPYSVADDDPGREGKLLGWRSLNWISPRPIAEELAEVLSPPIDYVKELGLEEFIDDKTGRKKYRIRKGDKRNKNISEVRLRLSQYHYVNT